MRGIPSLRQHRGHLRGAALQGQNKKAATPRTVIRGEAANESANLTRS
jgi:hypothetical protein